MSRSNYIHGITKMSGREVLYIEDLDIGGMSVTNNIENVIREISVMERIDPKRYLVVYKDSEGTWDGFDPTTNRFVALNSDSLEDAVIKYEQLLQLEHII